MLGIQIAGKGIDGFEHARQCALSHALHIRLFHVLTLDTGKHFRVNSQMAIHTGARGIGRSALAQDRTQQKNKNQTAGGHDDGKLRTAVHKDLDAFRTHSGALFPSLPYTEEWVSERGSGG